MGRKIHVTWYQSREHTFSMVIGCRKTTLPTGISLGATALCVWSVSEVHSTTRGMTGLEYDNGIPCTLAI